MVRAAVRGVVDFSKAEVDDPRWVRRTHVLLTEMSKEDDRNAGEVRLRLWCSYLANGWLEESDFKKFQGMAREECQHLLDDIYPWTNTTDAAGRQAAALEEAYKAQFGKSPDDPELLAEIEEGIRKHEIAQRAERAETDDERVMRLIKERDLERIRK